MYFTLQWVNTFIVILLRNLLLRQEQFFVSDCLHQPDRCGTLFKMCIAANNLNWKYLTELLPTCAGDHPASRRGDRRVPDNGPVQPKPLPTRGLVLPGLARVPLRLYGHGILWRCLPYGSVAGLLRLVVTRESVIGVSSRTVAFSSDSWVCHRGQ